MVESSSQKTSAASTANNNTNNNNNNNATCEAAATRDVSDVLEERLIDAEYKIWKKNTPYLYDFVMTHALEWPSLTCQWLPTVKGGGDASNAVAEEHSMLIGTHTTGEQNYLMVASVNLPNNEPVVREDDAPDVVAASYDEEKNELGGHGAAASSAVGKIEIRMKIKHEGEVNRARYMPQNHFIVASRGPNPEIHLWDFSKHSSFPTEGSAPSPQGVCLGHSMEGYGLCWSEHNEGMFISASDDTTVCLWDVRSLFANKTATGMQIHPISTFRAHTDVVEDVDWHHRDENLIGSVGDDRTIRIWDVREKNPNQAVHVVENAHDGDVNSIAFNPVNEFLFATGSADKTVALWDMRNLKCPLQTLASHRDQVYNVEWSPFNETILASCSADRRVGIWDLSRIGMEQTPEDAEDGPPELLFLHGGHTSKVSDFSWNMNNEWTIASVSEDNVLQVWNMAEETYAEGEEEIMSTGEDDDDVLSVDDLE